MSDFATLGSLLVSIGSLVVSIIALWKSSRAQHEANEIQRRLVHIEEQREYDRQAELAQANLHAELRKTDKSYRLYLVNSGKAEARNVRVKLDGVPLIDHCATVRGDSIPSRIGPNSEVSCLLAITLDCSPPFKIEVKWDDDYDKDRIYSGILTF